MAIVELEIELMPETGELVGVARLTPAAPAPSPLVLELLEPLAVDSVSSGGRELAWSELPPSGDSGSASDTPLFMPATRRLRIDLGEPATGDAQPVVIEIRYRGVLRQDWAAGERAGEIHNFAVEAHIGAEGIYLSSGVPWYPRPPAADEAGAALPLIDHRVTLRGVPGMLLVASGNRVADGDPEVGADETWRTPFPLPGVSVAGGPRRPHVRRAGAVTVVAHLVPESEAFAEPLLDAAVSYLELYQPLIGPYPYRELAIVENFFSSGFAYPGFTLLASAVIRMGESALRPGYLDHEILHAWWGNGVLRAPGEGIWSEGLASYCANLMRDELEGRHDVARAHRRSILEGLSRADPEAERPLASFGTPGGASRFVGYQKGSLVFAELARQVGAAPMWYALRTLASTRMGEPTGWNDLEVTLERATGRELGPFFDFWVRGVGAPDLSPRAAVWTANASGDGGRLRLELAGPTPIAVPALEVRLTGGAQGAEPTIATVDVPAAARAVDLRLERRPAAVEVDPDFRAARRLPAEVWMPTISGLSPSQPLRIVRAAEEDDALAERYEVVAAALRERYQERGELREERVRSRRGGAPPDAWGDGHLLVLGRAALAAPARELLDLAGLGIDGEAGSFTLDGEEHADPADAVLACVRRPGRPGAVACIVWGNTAAALARAHLLTFYGGDSLLRFADGQPVARLRFEGVERIAVTDEE